MLVVKLKTRCRCDERGALNATFGVVARMYRLFVLLPDRRLLGLVLVRVDTPCVIIPSLREINGDVRDRGSINTASRFTKVFNFHCTPTTAKSTMQTIKRHNSLRK